MLRLCNDESDKKNYQKLDEVGITVFYHTFLQFFYVYFNALHLRKQLDKLRFFTSIKLFLYMRLFL